MLRLQAESVALLVSVSLFSNDGSVQEITGIQLHRRFCRVDLKHSTAIRFASSGRQREAVVLPLDHEIVIVAMPDHQLLVVVVDSGANRRGRREIQRGSFYRPNFAGRDERFVGRREAVGVEHDFVP